MSQNILKFCMYKPSSLGTIISNIKLFSRNLKFAWQRVKWGFSAADTWNWDLYHSQLVANSLSYFRDHHSGVPSYLCHDNEGNEIDIDEADALYIKELNNIIDCFNIVRADDGELRKNNKYNFKNWNEIRDFKSKALHEGLQKLEEIYFDLWD